jgi:anti-anti-sigma factor
MARRAADVIHPVDLRLDRSVERTVVTLTGEVDLSNAAMVRRAILESVPNLDMEVAVDLTRVRYLDSAGIAMLFDLARRLSEHNQRLTMVVPSASLVRRSLEASGWPPDAPVLESLDPR